MSYWNLLNDKLRLELIQWLNLKYPHILEEFLKKRAENNE